MQRYYLNSVTLSIMSVLNLKLSMTFPLYMRYYLTYPLKTDKTIRKHDCWHTYILVSRLAERNYKIIMQ